MDVAPATKQPDGQITKSLSSPLRKNISVYPKCKSGYMIRRLAPLKGRIAIVTNAGRDAWTRMVLLTRAPDADGKNVWS